KLNRRASSDGWSPLGAKPSRIQRSDLARKMDVAKLLPSAASENPGNGAALNINGETPASLINFFVPLWTSRDSTNKRRFSSWRMEYKLAASRDHPPVSQ